MSDTYAPGYTAAQYVKGIGGSHSGISALIDGVAAFVPVDPANADYANIVALVEAGTLTIVSPPA